MKILRNLERRCRDSEGSRREVAFCSVRTSLETRLKGRWHYLKTAGNGNSLMRGGGDIKKRETVVRILARRVIEKENGKQVWQKKKTATMGI